mmetsp:Transcript_33342/g.33959  ORF Transcript_33342/g.33959 Transcript_33342/m.33959 type:complete len:520 (+) Transcript_33342:122-1681(+)|eukprot:CAMPEP_0182418538 /NCGR_PEP_ID=MMETSP1167-20130531/2942_1 /TAXON_ID=2988 /ORGANISM="Mallomonas Sp, Strain CCMP3275" /LENGTH=519 /DNA_ID=CAMNT_0024592789 /DNA_START=38 /DNA_END=1597 /DNA_ORIENTATION=-
MATGDKSTSEVLQMLQNKSDYYTRLTIIERKRLDDLNDALEHINKESENYRGKAKNEAISVMNMRSAGLTPNPAYTRADGANIGKEADMVTRKTLEILEVKLNRRLQRRSEVINQNKLLKANINHMRRLRLQTDISHKSMETELIRVKEHIENIMKESTDMLEQREKTLELKDLYERQNLEEQMKFEEDYESMGRFIREQNSLLEESLLHERKTDLVDDFEYQRGELSLEDEEYMAGRVGMLTNSQSNEQQSLATIQETINNYEMMFEQLKRITNSESLEEVMSTYSAHEEEMFSMYNYIQTQNTEIESCIENTLQIKDEIKNYKFNQQQQDDQKKRVIDGLKSRLEATQEATSVCDEKNRIQSDSVEQLAKKVQSLFFKLQCDQMDSAKAGPTASKGQNKQSLPREQSKISIIAGQPVSESNVLDFMGAIEQRAVDIISDYLKSQSRVDGGRPKSPVTGPSTPMKWPGDSMVELPEFSEEDMLGDEEGDSKPVDLTAFKEKLLRKVTLANSKEFRSTY